MPPRAVSPHRLLVPALLLVMASAAHAAAGWWQRLGDGAAPAARSQASLVLDPVRQRALVFGGRGPGLPFYDLWALGLERPWSWSPLYVPGTSPAPRTSAVFAYDPAGDRFLLYGGQLDYTYFGDSWSLESGGNLATWTRVSTLSAGPGARNAAGVWDSLGNRLLVVGGIGATWYNDVWALETDGASGTWTLVPTGNTRPDGRVYASVVLDTRRRRLVLFGGHNGGARDEVWVLPLASGTQIWEQLVVAVGPSPGARYGHVAGYDPVTDAMVIFGGSNGAQNYGDAWMLHLDGTPTWEQVVTSGATPGARQLAAGAWDSRRSRLVVYGGYLTQPLGDAWALTIGSPPLDVPPGAGALVLGAPSPQPAREEAWVPFTLPAAGRASVDLFDAAGRRVAGTSGVFGAGAQRARFATAALAPGLYFARLEAAGARRSAKLVVAH